MSWKSTCNDLLPVNLSYLEIFTNKKKHESKESYYMISNLKIIIHALKIYIILVYDLKSVGPLEFKLVAPMPEQLETTANHFYEVSRKPCASWHLREMHCCGPDLFWDGCKEIQILGPYIVDYLDIFSAADFAMAKL